MIVWSILHIHFVEQNVEVICVLIPLLALIRPARVVAGEEPRCGCIQEKWQVTVQTARSVPRLSRAPRLQECKELGQS